MEKKVLSVIIVVLLIVFISIVYLYFNDTNTNMESIFNEKNNSNIEDDFSFSKEDIESDIEFSDDELKNDYSDYSAKIDLNNLSIEGNGVKISGTTITVSKEGVYYFSGTAKDANIVVECDKEDIVVLVFDGANITSNSTAVINGIKAKEIIVNLAKGSVNNLIDSKEYTEFTEDDEPNSLIFSKTDLMINGTGKLIINANYKDGIASKDILKIKDCEIEITAEDDGIRGKDAVLVKDAKIKIDSKGDSIKTTNEEKLGYMIIDSGIFDLTTQKDAIDSKNYIIINDGEFEINAGDDGITTDNGLIINKGTINIKKSVEGLEAQYIEINDGKIYIISSDDGINVCGGNDNMFMGRENQASNTETDRKLVINGGEIFVNASGDGLDSNGSIVVNGGTIVVSGPTNSGNGAMDYNYSFTLTGGDLIYYGASGMWQDASKSENIYTVSFGVSNGKEGDNLVLKDESGNIVKELTTEKSYQRISFANEKIESGKKYTLYVNGEECGSLEVTDSVTTNAQNNMNGVPNFGGKRP